MFQQLTDLAVSRQAELQSSITRQGHAAHFMGIRGAFTRVARVWLLRSYQGYLVPQAGKPMDHLCQGARHAVDLGGVGLGYQQYVHKLDMSAGMRAFLYSFPGLPLIGRMHRPAIKHFYQLALACVRRVSGSGSGCSKACTMALRASSATSRRL